MSTVRDRSAGPPSGQPRMLRIEYKGQPYDWFNLDEMGEIVRTSDFSNTLRENITHYFGVPFEHQAVYDEEGLLSSMVDFSRALRSVRPWLRVYDAREMTSELKEKTAAHLEEIQGEVRRSQRSLGLLGSPDAMASSTSLQQQLFRSPPQNGSSPPRGQRDPSISLADAVRSSSGSAMLAASQQGPLTPPKPLPPTAFPWNTASTLEAAYNMPNSRYPTPPPLNYQQSFSSQLSGPQTSSSQIPGVIPSQVRNAPYAWGSNQMPLGGAFGVTPPMAHNQASSLNYGGMGRDIGVRDIGGFQSQLPRATGSSTPPLPGANGSSIPPLAGGNSLPSTIAPPLSGRDSWRQVGERNVFGTSASAAPPPQQAAEQNVFVASASAAPPQQQATERNLLGEMASATPPLHAAGMPGSARSSLAATAPVADRGFSMAPAEDRHPSSRSSRASRRPSANDQAPGMIGGIVEVNLAKDASGLDRYGFANVPTHDNRALTISWIDLTGLLEQRWNREVQKESQVVEGDIILAVNGKKDDVEAMREQLKEPMVTLTIQHNAQARRSDSK